ncbi:MAG: c-type cytochrome biogenesis protein CcmI [Methylococcaceae bacterium]
MTGFWLVAILLLLLGYVFFIPAFNPKQGSTPRRDRLNVLLHRQRQGELVLEEPDNQNRAFLEADSSRNLLNDLESPKEKESGDLTRGRIPLIVTLCLLPMVILVSYLALGRPDMIEGTPLLQAQSANPASSNTDMNASIQRLAERLKNNPNDVEGWMLLGRSLQSTRQFNQAAEAYAYGLKLEPDNPDIKAMYAESLAEANQGKLAGRPVELIEEVLKTDPQHKNALWLAGIAAAERGDRKQAVDFWQKLRLQLPPDSPDVQQIDNIIADMQGQPAPRPATGGSVAAEAKNPGTISKRLQVAVTLAPNLKDKASPDDALFIFARAAEGPPMPLAVVRKQVKDLPVEVSLDDTMSMMPGMNLSSFERIILGARISKTGKPTPSEGDLQGLTQALAAENNKRYEVLIKDVVVGK